MLGYAVFIAALCLSAGVVYYLLHSLYRLGAADKEKDGLKETLDDVAKVKKARSYLSLGGMLNDATRKLRQKYQRD